MQAAVVALASVSRCLSSLLGPERRLKFVEGGVVTDDALRVLTALSIDHPAVTLLLEACEGLHATYGCGVATLACLASELANAVAHHCEQGGRLRAVIGGMREAVRHACDVLTSVAAPLPEWDALCDGLTHRSPLEMSLAKECAQLLGASPWQLRRSLHVLPMGGKPAAHSVVWPGMVMPLDSKRATAVEQVLLRGTSCDCERGAIACYPPLASDGSGSKLATHSFSVDALLLEGDLTVEADGGLAQKGEMASNATPIVMGSAEDAARALRPLSSDAARLSKNLCAAGVRLLLVNGYASTAVESRLADEGVLLLSGIPPPAFHSFCEAADVAPLRDARSLLAADARLKAIRLRGCVLQGGLGATLTAGTRVDSSHDCYLHVRAAEPSHADRWRRRASSVVLVSCGATEDAANITADGVRRCLHRLQGATRDARVLPGGGAAELACAAALEREATRSVGSPRPAAEQEERNRALRADTMHSLSCALQQLLRLRAHNAGATADEAADGVAGSLARWLRLSDDETRRLCTEDSPSSRLDPAWTPLLAWSGGGAHGDGCHAPIFDLLALKVSILHASVDLLEQVLLPDMIVSNQ